MSTPKPLPPKLPPILTQFQVTANITSSFLTVKDLTVLSCSSSKTRDLYGPARDKSALGQLLHDVLNGNAAHVRNMIHSFRPVSKGLILAKSQAKEEYCNPGFNIHDIKRTWTSISPLEAAAWIGDNFLVIDLLLQLSENHYADAINQLTTMINRMPAEENGVYLAPFRELCQAYNKLYHGSPPQVFDEVYGRYRITDREAWSTVSLQQRLLPIYGLQEMHDDKKFHPLPSFTKEPHRGRIRLCKFLYEASGQISGQGPSYGLAKGICEDLHVFHKDNLSFEGNSSVCPLVDLLAFQHLIKVKEQQLVQIINLLQQGDKKLLKNFFSLATGKNKKKGCIVS